MAKKKIVTRKKKTVRKTAKKCAVCKACGQRMKKSGVCGGTMGTGGR